MKQTTRTLIGLAVLLGLAGGIGGVAMWAQRDEAKKTEAREKSEKLFDFDKGQAKELRIEKDGKLAVALVKGEKGWKLTQPVQTDGEDSAVESLLSTLSGLKQKKDLGDEKDAKQFGLDKPSLAVTVKLADGKEQGLQVGLESSFDNTLYVRRLSDPTIRVLDGYVKTSLDKGAFDLRDKKVARLDDAVEVKRVEVTAVKVPYVLEKDGTAWKLGGAVADSAAADRVVSSVKGLRATGVAAESAKDLKPFGLDKPRAVAKLSVSSGKDAYARTVKLGQTRAQGAVAQKTYAMRDDSPTVFEVDAQIVKDLEKEPFDLQDKLLVHADREAVRELVFESPSGVVKVARKKEAPADGGAADETFTVSAPQQGAAKKWKLSSALYSITGLHAAAFDGKAPAAKDLAKYGLDKPKTVTLLGEGGKILARVRAGAEKDGKRYVLADGVDKLARVEKVTIDEWPWTAADALEGPPTPQASK